MTAVGTAVAGSRHARCGSPVGDVPRPTTATGDAGGASVEFALVLPALVLVLGLVVGGAAVAGTAVRVADAAAVVARQVARGDASAAPGTLTALVPGATMAQSTTGDLVCVVVRADVRVGGLPTPVPVTSRSCAPTAGR